MRLLKILIYLNLFLLQSYLIRFDLFGYPSNLQEILILTTAFTFLTLKIKSGTLLTSINRLKTYRVLVFFIIGTIVFSTLRPIINELDLIRYLKFAFFAVTFTFIALETFKTDQERKSLVQIGGYGALTFGVFSLIYNLAGYNVALDQRLLGPLDAAVYLGYYLTPFFIFFSLESINSLNKKGSLARPHLLPAIALGLLIIATRSMGSIAGSFVVIAIYLLAQSNFEILKKKSAKIGLSIVTLLILGTITYTKVLPTLKYENSSLDERGEIWKTSAYILTHNPQSLVFGLGPNQFQEHYDRNVKKALGHEPLDYIVLQPHNIFLFFIFNYGLFGLIALLFLISQVVFSVRTPSLTTQQSVTTPATYIMLYFLLHGLIDTPFLKNDMLILIILIAQIMLAKTTPSAHSLNPSKPHKDQQPS